MALTPEQQEELEKEKQLVVKEESQPEIQLQTSQTSELQAQMDNTMAGLLSDVVENHKDDMLALTDRAFKNELDIRETQTEGRKKKEKAKVGKEVTEEQIKEDEAKHERAKTILKAQGLTSQLPKWFRITALIVGYPFFVVYLLSLGWIIEFLTFTIKGFITMVADCVERFTEVNAKIIENSNNKDFKLSRAIINILKWLLIIGAVVAVIVLLILK